ncbi:hypothetical protein P154DRAFT_573620 [Amniculicola lignicola CBS 123094]|uniref:Uncharacterized protein n=1 Tax=Amniculicola lignicola CBS 123094 TaxID=1392246 RepID=A0A6A5WLH0_9PLEO|nr:hypothetical protein P154DRAFT_573620 [Amniculicola lignicola CBS 123094]
MEEVTSTFNQLLKAKSELRIAMEGKGVVWPKLKIWNSAVNSYSRSLCLILAHRIYTTFPRELRDEIYAHFWASLKDESERFASLLEKEWRVCENRPLPPAYSGSLVLAQSSFVGINVAREALQSLWRSTSISGFLDDVDDIKRYLDFECLDLGLALGHLIRHVVVTVPLHHHSRLALQNLYAPAHYTQEPSSTDTLGEKLAGFDCIRNKDRFRLDILVRVFSMTPYTCLTQTMDQILPSFEQLKSRGSWVTVRLDMEGIIYPFIKPVSVDLTRCLEMDKELWYAQIKADVEEAVEKRKREGHNTKVVSRIDFRI